MFQKEMFFLMGISDEQKDLQHNQMVICGSCGRYGRYIVYMTCTVLSLFFIPCFKWNKQYFVRMSCCGATFRLDPEIGKRIARGENVEILPEHLTPAGGGWQQWNREKHCMNCGFSTTEDFEFCPKCGRRFQ